MNEVIAWACSICAGAAICLVCEMVLPSGKISKIVKFTIGVFMVSIIILPLGRIVSAVSNEFNNIKVEDYSSKMDCTVQDEAVELAKKNISRLVEKELDKINVKTKKIEVITDSQKLNDITSIELIIYIDKEDRGRWLEIKKCIEDKLKLDCKVRVIGEKKNG